MNSLHFRIWSLVGLLAFSAAERLSAQTPNADPATGTRIALRITDLTNEERDAVNRQLTDSGNAHIAFACVPAGLIIIEATDATRNMDSLRLRTMPGLLRSVAPARISEDHLTLQRAEELCAEMRNQ